MSSRPRRSGWLVLLLVAIGGGAAWAWRMLRDDGDWTPDPAGSPWEPRPTAPTPAPAAPADVAADPDVLTAQDLDDLEVTEVEAPEVEDAEVSPAGFAALADAPARAGADSLVRLEGVGPKIAAALAGAGLTSFAAIADADDDTLRAALRAAGLRFAPSLPTWSAQARLLADGDEAGFTAMTARLTGGRDA